MLLVVQMTLPIAGEVHRLAARQCKARDAMDLSTDVYARLFDEVATASA